MCAPEPQSHNKFPTWNLSHPTGVPRPRARLPGELRDATKRGVVAWIPQLGQRCSEICRSGTMQRARHI
ncbi:uncharacterized protein PHACADRAFT_266438 [Phanerochaete carnosa HHB-10118-sp]|uniref:Uncharacterized protein n=1 Tax=Phanerochaete carnosa (strain HHB-10118-sp) TaxID=650164 RepID=K5WDU1_PHACS|nr:uncharacterized protein PHACADRAFT_266438 [Phanerochaete carnosa HHB-10118-sp]EKM48302.1 hypothetical protein PHACADRAFT_266438 [Phanerochaete carnosa HHB-10118-sp]